jgi:hypothetical protein
VARANLASYQAAVLPAVRKGFASPISNSSTLSATGRVLTADDLLPFPDLTSPPSSPSPTSPFKRTLSLLSSRKLRRLDQPAARSPSSPYAARWSISSDILSGLGSSTTRPMPCEALIGSKRTAIRSAPASILSSLGPMSLISSRSVLDLAPRPRTASSSAAAAILRRSTRCRPADK